MDILNDCILQIPGVAFPIMHSIPALEWRKGTLPRLAPEYYRGHAFVFWTHTIEQRCKDWLSPSFYACFRELLLHALARYELACPIYCLMPDHIHLVWLGLSPASDQQRASQFLRQHVGPSLLPAAFQKQPHDHVLREKERERNAFQSTCYYVRENPVRAGLAAAWADYRYSDAVVPGYPELNVRAEDFWIRFWRVYAYVRQRNEGKALPPHP